MTSELLLCAICGRLIAVGQLPLPVMVEKLHAKTGGRSDRAMILVDPSPVHHCAISPRRCN